ncbi:response regulator [Desulfuromonas sp. CSMB_57]|uniref:response regulator n=1 Tax=Desulfuromonas sp. CSMB_57 TaxID=2807629 RepID=UPI001CD1FDC2|nr:response regulator [Desulfuromonas sp. CSMB_57]
MSKAKILVIDDEKNILFTVRQTLEADGYEVSTATTGEAGLRMAAEANFDLVLLDLKLPGIDGVEVLRQLEQRPRRSQVIVISAYGTVTNAVEVMKLGALDFIEKPFAPRELREAVLKVLSRPEPGTDPGNDYNGWIALSKRCAAQGQLGNAIAHARHATGLEPDRPEAFNLLGAYSEMQGKAIEAQKYYRAALELNPGYLPSQANLNRLVMKTKGPLLLGQE